MTASLFQSNAWQSAWWDTWGHQAGFELVRKWDGKVSGLYESNYRLKGVLPVRSLQFVGTSYRELRTPRTEYNRFCEENSGGKELVDAMESLLEERAWTEAVFKDLRTGSSEVSALVTIAATRGWAFRVTSSDHGYAVNTAGCFTDYIGSLGAKSRLRLYNRRKIFESLGQVQECNLWPDNTDQFFSELNRFHLARWQKKCVTEKSLEFHKRFLSRIVHEGGRPVLSVIYCNGKVVSVLYNVWFEGVVYNIQAGFEEGFHPKLSLGSLHLGYAIEDAFLSPDTMSFDLLAGQGKREDYKARFSTVNYQFVSIMLVKSVLFRALYWMRG